MGELVKSQVNGSESLTTSLVKAIATREGVEPTSLSPPLNTVIDMDALEVLFTGQNDGFVHITFSYNGYRITVEGEEDAQITIE